MVGPRKIKEIVTEDGSFMGLSFPKLKNVHVDLKSTKEITKSAKTGEIIEELSPNFKITLKLTGFNNEREDPELSIKIQEATQLKFPPYHRNGGYYSFYTSGFQSTQSKLDIYKNLISVVSEYVQEKKDEVILYKEDFKDDYKNKFIMETRDMLLMPYHAKGVEPMFLVVLKEKVSPQTYSYLKRESFYSGYLSPNKDEVENQNISASFYNVQQYFPSFKRKNGFFLIPPSSYSVVKTFLKSEVAKEGFFYEEQLKKAEKLDVTAVEYQDDNIFGIYIKYIEDKGIYLFKGKGYKDNSPVLNIGIRGNYYAENQRTLLGLWANNLIYAEKISDSEIEDRKIASKEFFIENSNKIELTFLPGGSAKDGYFIPVSDYNKLLTIKENIQKENKIWGRYPKLIDIYKETTFKNNWFSQYPVVLINDSGSAYLCYSLREKRNKESGKLECTTFKGVEINKNEVADFLTNHPFSSGILKASIDISVLACANVKNDLELNRLTEKEKREIFDTLLLHFNLKQETKAVDKSNPKVKKF